MASDRRRSLDINHKITHPGVVTSSSSSAVNSSIIVPSSSSSVATTTTSTSTTATSQTNLSQQGHRRNVSFGGDVRKIISGERDRIVQGPINDTSSKEIATKQTISLPDSPVPTVSPKSNSGSISPRKLINQVVSKLNKKSTQEDEIIKQKEKYGNDIYDGKNMIIGEKNFDMCYYASVGDLEKLKQITDTGEYTPDDIKSVIVVANKCGKFDIVRFLTELKDE